MRPEKWSGGKGDEGGPSVLLGVAGSGLLAGFLGEIARASNVTDALPTLLKQGGLLDNSYFLECWRWRVAGLEVGFRERN